VHEAGRVNWAALDATNFMKEFHKRVSCSALVTYTGDAIRAGHTTWTSYNNMLRIYKRVTWNLDGKPVHKVAFSSRPGYLYSKDDFYTLPLQRMIVMETTNAVFENSLYDKVVPTALMAWQRVPVSNFLAKDGTEWAEMMSHYNSGTYNNQWIAITLDRASKAGLQDGFLTIAEQIPGEVKVTDVTDLVRRQGYFSSYNVPFDDGIFHKSGYIQQIAKMGDENSYINCSRARIFRRDAPNARTSMKDFKRVLGSNNYQTDPFSLGDPNKAIMSRGDLDIEAPSLFGAVDTKVTEVVPGAENWDGTAWARSGPTTDNQPPFSWLTIPDSEPVLHLGQPAIFDFDYVPMAFSDAAGISPIPARKSFFRSSISERVQWLDFAAQGPMSREVPVLPLLCIVGVACTLLGFVAQTWRRRGLEDESGYFLQS